MSNPTGGRWEFIDSRDILDVTQGASRDKALLFRDELAQLIRILEKMHSLKSIVGTKAERSAEGVPPPPATMPIVMALGYLFGVRVLALDECQDLLPLPPDVKTWADLEKATGQGRCITPATKKLRRLFWSERT